ncbi:cupin [Gordonia sp. HNM0687]|uniref:Cupin n=1 Tax=Gordonia mangrovi TaxID=2665643 RepID=A0A6L7GNL5_9ACTN|nr:cupin domain-containing protein [Gordonia mangrovi]MXP21202.1 cupin [Gordonia mangrovi]UVF80929.1 cupin domain-containing protein [Gordonia mangrovi]
MLSRCISIDAADFARDHWGRRPLLSRADTLPRDFGDLLSPATVDELLTERGVRAPFIRMAKEGELLARDCYLGSAGFGAEIADQVDAAKVLARFADGATIVLQGLHRLWPPVIEFARDMVDELGHPVQTNAYITPPDNRGFDPHYDVHDVFVLQVSGCKRWLVHKPVHRDPLDSQPWTDHRSAIVDRAREQPVIDAVLRPGDAVYLPRGWVHSAQAMGETSIHLTVGVSPVTGHDVVRAITDALGDTDMLRESLAVPLDLADHDHTAAITRKVLTSVIEVLRADTDDLADAAATRLSRRHADRTRPVAVAPLATLDAIAGLDATTPVVWRPGLIGRLQNRDGRVVLRLPDRSITFPASCADALSAIRAGQPVEAGALPGLDTADGCVLVRRLLREAVVIPVDRPGRGR